MKLKNQKHTMTEVKKETEKKYRFFFHYYKRYKCLSIHFKGKCYRANDVICEVPINSKWNKTQPNLVMQGFAKKIIIEKDVCTIK